MKRQKKINNFRYIFFLIMLFIFFDMVRFIIPDNFILKGRYFIPIIIVFLLVLHEQGIFIINVRIFSFIIFWLLFGGICGYYNNNLSISKIYIQIMYMIIAYTLLIFPRLSKYVEILIWFLHIYFLVVFLVYHSFSYAFINTSENYVSVFYLLLLTILAIQKDKLDETISLFHPSIALVYSVLAGGKGGIFSLLMLMFLLILNSNSKKKKVFLFLFGLAILVFLFGWFTEYFTTFWHTISSIKGLELSSNGRMIFWKNYLKECTESLKSLFCGANITHNLGTYESYTPPHLHNSFLTFYAQYGLVVFVTTLVVITEYFYNGIKEKEKSIVFIYVGVFLLRSFTDLVFAGYIGDIVLYMIIFDALKYKRYKLYGKYKYTRTYRTIKGR